MKQKKVVVVWVVVWRVQAMELTVSTGGDTNENKFDYYVGVDPNPMLKEGYEKMINMFARDASKWVVLHCCRSSFFGNYWEKYEDASMCKFLLRLCCRMKAENKK